MSGEGPGTVSGKGLGKGLGKGPESRQRITDLLGAGSTADAALSRGPRPARIPALALESTRGTGARSGRPGGAPRAIMPGRDPGGEEAKR